MVTDMWGLPFPSRLVSDLTTPQTLPQGTIWLQIVGCETSNMQQEQYSKIIFVLTDYFRPLHFLPCADFDSFPVQMYTSMKYTGRVECVN